MDHSLPLESAPEIDFDNVREDTDETPRRRCYIDYSERKFTALFDFNNITADKDSSNSDNLSDSESNESENEEVPSRKKKVEKNRKWSTLRPKSK